ncbi:MAG: hypothetical protein AAF633_03035, partial [Chloroflexota bacterium]
MHIKPLSKKSTIRLFVITVVASLTFYAFFMGIGFTSSVANGSGEQLITNPELESSAGWDLNQISLERKWNNTEAVFRFQNSLSYARQTGISPSQNGIYELEVNCSKARVFGSISLAKARFSSDNPVEDLWSGDTHCPFYGSVLTIRHQGILLASQSYSLTLSALTGGVSANSAFLTLVDQVENLDTGLVENGDFIGDEGWLTDSEVRFRSECLAGYCGTMHFQPAYGIMDSDFTVPTDGVYEVSYECHNSSALNPYQLRVQIFDGSPTLIDSYSAICAYQDWGTYTFTATLSSGAHSISIENIGTGGVDPIYGSLYLDNVSIKNNALPVEVTLACEKEEKNCSASNAQSMLFNTNTFHGGSQVNAPQLIVPTSGMNLVYGASNLSAMAQISNTASSSLGNYWVHNYETELLLSTPAVTDVVQFRTSVGNFLSFTANGNGTYTPKDGVLSTLVLLQDGTYELVTSDQIRYLFDASGKMTQKSDPSGNTLYFEYYSSGADSGKLEKARNADNTRYLTYTYNGNGNLQLVTDHSGREMEHFYDSNGHLTSIENPMDEPITYVYSGTTPFLTEVYDGESLLLKKMTYDSEGRATKIENGAGDVLGEITYHEDGQRTVVEQGVVMTHTYNSQNLLTDITYACPDGSGDCGPQTAHTQNFRNNRMTDANDNETSLTWSGDGSNLNSMVNALGQATSMTYDSLNNLTSVTNALGQTTEMRYENSLHPTFMTRMIDALGHTTIYTPTASGQIGEMLAADGTLTAYTYNTFGQITETRTGVGTSSEIVTRYGYDSVGRPITTTRHSPSGSIADISSLTVYDSADRVVATIENWTGSNPSSWQSDCVQTTGERETNICTTRIYDDAGRVTQTTNPIGQTNISFYDETGRSYLSIQNYTDPNGYGYDTDLNNDGNLDTPATIIAAYCVFNDSNAANADKNLCSTTEYDSFSRVVATKDSLGRITRTEYDELGRVNGTIVNSVSVTALSGCSYPPTNPDQDLCSTNEYDAVGNLIRTTDSVGRANRMFYDELNRAVGQIANDSGTYTTLASLSGCYDQNAARDTDLCSETIYDEVGNAILTIDSAGRRTRSFYDDLNRVDVMVQNWDGSLDKSQCTYDQNNLSESNICTQYGYNAQGQQITVRNALDQTSLTVYDDLGRPFMNVANWSGASITSEVDCQFPPASSDTDVCSVTYFDDLGRQFSSKDPMGNVTDITYDTLGRTISTTRYLIDGQTTISVTTGTTFDALGNRLASTDADGHTMSYSYDGINRLLMTTSAEGITATQTYNQASWVITTTNGLGHATNSRYDNLGRLIGVTNAESELTQYIYDALGNQVAMIDANLVRTSYLYDELNRLDGVVENDTTPFNVGVSGNPAPTVGNDQDLLT